MCYVRGMAFSEVWRCYWRSKGGWECIPLCFDLFIMFIDPSLLCMALLDAEEIQKHWLSLLVLVESSLAQIINGN